MLHFYPKRSIHTFCECPYIYSSFVNLLCNVPDKSCCDRMSLKLNIFMRNIYKTIYDNLFFGTLTHEGSCKITVCLSVYLFVHQFGLFLRNGSLVFSDFLYDGKKLEYLKTDRALFFQENSFLPKVGLKRPKMVPK